jgi:hypothetical protein
MRRSLRLVAAVLLLFSAVEILAARGTDPPRGLLLDRTYLDTIRDRVRSGDRRLQRGLTTLEADARTALQLAPMSVMDKSIVPPSGDKHDYMSQAPYWWPDPAKPGGRPYIRRDGERNPEITRIPDHDNLGKLTNAVSTLALSFYFTGRTEYAAHAARLVRVWFIDPATRMNPHLRFGQGIPGINDGRGIGIIETRGLPELLDGILLLSDSNHWTDPDETALQRWMREYTAWLLESPHGKDEARNGNNHETWYDVQVAGLALYTRQYELARRILEGSRDRIARHIEPDGRQPREIERTRGWDYSIFNLTAFFHLAALGDRVGVDLWHFRSADGRSLRQALDYLMPFAAGEREWPTRQITPFRPSALHWLLRRAALVWKDPMYASLAAKVGGGTARMDLTVPEMM